MNKNIDIFENYSVAKAVNTMAIPTVIGQLIVLVYSIADTFFIGRTENHLMVAGASLILPVFNICISLANLAGVGGGAQISRLLGVNKIDEAKKTYSFSVYLGLISTGVFSLLVLIFMRPLMTLLGAGPDTYEYASKYALCVIVIGGIPTVMSNVLSTLLRSVGESKKAGLGITIGGVVNIALDPLFMFVIFPQGMEIIGAGVATCLSNCISCVFFMFVIKKLNDPVLKLGNISQVPTKDSLKGIFAVGLPSSLATFLFDLDYIVIDKLMSVYGDVELAAIGIVLKAERLPLNIGIGLSQGMMPIVAYNYSAKNYKRMSDTKRYTMIVGLVCAAISIGLYELFASQIMRFFINDIGTVTIGTDFLRVRVLATPLMFLCFFHVFLFNGFGKGKQALFLGVVRWAILNIPMLFLLNTIMGIYGLVWTQVIADAITVVISIFVYRSFEKKTISPEVN